MKCSSIRRVIDEADNPANLPYKAAGHLERCVACRQFAGEREQLRKLLLEPPRVSAPADFEAIVIRRLALGGSQRRPFWLASGFYLRAAGAAAALACMTLVIQVTLLRPVPPRPSAPGPDMAISKVSPNTGHPGVTGAAPRLNPTERNSGSIKLVRHGFSPRASVKAKSKATLASAVADMTIQPRALLLVRSSSAEHEIAVPMVSVGAQPWLSVSLRSQDEQGVRTAF